MTVRIDKKICAYAIKSDTPVLAAATHLITEDADRRITLDPVEVPVSSSLRWEHRPRLEKGNEAKVYQIEGPEHRFFVVVGYLKAEHGEGGYPFEVLVCGEGPRALKGLAKSISLDMRSQDRGWLKLKLEAIAKTEGESFEMDMPDGSRARMPSEVAAFARLVLFQCKQLGAFSDANLAQDTSLQDALMSKRRPRTTADGGLAWYVDIDNPATGDRFKLFLPELHQADGTKRPYEVWFDGVYPIQSFRGLAKSLSLDLQIVDIGWAVRKLRQLTSVKEEQGDLWAQVPGSNKSACFPSTTAYVAELILHRLKVLGLVDNNGKSATISKVVSIRPAGQLEHKPRVPHMLDCSSCGILEAVKLDGGCAVCTACGASSCG